jgi:hypothetical protein
MSPWASTGSLSLINSEHLSNPSEVLHYITMPLTGPWRGASSRRLAKVAGHGPVPEVRFLPTTPGLIGGRRKLSVRRWALIDAGPGEQDGQTGERRGADYREPGDG